MSTTLLNQVSILKGIDRPDFIRNETLADIFRQTAKKYSVKTALIFGNSSVTYQELDRWSDAIAANLAANGIKRGDKVGIWYKRGLELHAAIIGIIKVGAAYIPVDREIPAERVETIFTEVEASAYISEDLLNLDFERFEVRAKPTANEEIVLPEGPEPDNLAYVLYTSGSTGKPKGIPIGHRQICHLVRSEQSVINIRETDRVYQGFSVSFDMWCEETWVSYFAGATLWVADNTTSKAIDELSDVLNSEKITVLHAVPSLLAVIEDNIPSLRMVNAGGEACTVQVLNRWSTPNRIFYNSYGPTETTVSATFAPLKPGDPISIGDPLPNYNLAVVDEKLNPLPFGERGELVISGPGVAEGYVNLPNLTHEKFVLKTAALEEMPGEKIYRTGDAALIKEDGSIEFLGRFDDQIKLRGYRIELGEIETKLSGLQDISAAAVAVKKDSSGQDQLVGYVVTEGGIAIEENLLRLELAKVLPSYMVPAIIVLLPEMPRMPSGKVNRKALPTPESLLQTIPNEAEETLDLNASLSDRLLNMLRVTFPNKTIDLSMDFFNDLGGHSLLAAGLVSRLRREGGIPKASLRDIYLHRPLEKLVEVWGQQTPVDKKPERKFHKVNKARYYSCWLAQTLALGFIYSIFAIQIFIPYLGYYYVQQATDNLGYAIVTSLVLFCFVPPLFFLISIGSKWLVIGKFKEGDYPLWGSYYFRWWFVKTIQRLLTVQFLNGTPLYPAYLKLFGMKVAADAQLGDFTSGAEDLITIGNDVSISSGVNLNNVVVEDGLLKIRSIVLGDHAYLGSSAIVAGGAVMEAWSELQDLSYLQEGKTIRSGEVWRGSPAQLKETKSISDLPQPLPVSAWTRKKYMLIFTLSLLVFPFTILLPLLPTIITLNRLDDAAPDYNFTYMVVVPSLALVYILLFAFETIVLTRLLQRGIKPGTYPIYSTFYLRKWFADQLMSLSLIVLHPIYATVYISSFFRALGAKIGKNTEISTASSVTHPLLKIGSGAFIADAVVLGESDIRGQQLILDYTEIDSGTFVGNSALIPQGTQLPGNMLIGVLSIPPEKKELEQNHAKDWFGSPAIALPRRQESNPFSEELTAKPSFLRKLARGTVEFIRIVLPETAIIIFSIFFIAYGHDLITQQPWYKIILLFPLYYLGFMGLPAFFTTVILKYVFIGRFKAQQKPMWHNKVWRSEAITTTYEALSVPFLLDYLRGTPWLPITMRILGVKICNRVWMNTTDITEFDMVSLGDDVALNENCGPQTHLFEDRVMKVGTVKIGSRSSIGAGTIVLYDTEIGTDCKIDALSLVMKGERLAPGTDWTGSPVQPV
ncbi:Pls/PosA family non-ribosomal peptide synthetase [Mucilaginibacter arboris]|uniref:Amino acid adenylation domain-containing protein n=1 Tax=Mucilaginibacter arboris TaxID=2682090 RepID=A0A7K1SZ01_9SPHI|nr:Pls/PosA family non-ribosomal peptide synthetase [Mucilaginibacter arboris]MVN22488.1 amino acid adenylation domain-containing protein [Mucilaginibacter arboris]